MWLATGVSYTGAPAALALGAVAAALQHGLLGHVMVVLPTRPRGHAGPSRGRGARLRGATPLRRDVDGVRRAARRGVPLSGSGVRPGNRTEFTGELLDSLVVLGFIVWPLAYRVVLGRREAAQRMAGLLDAGDEARRRIERDLHDG